MPHAETYSAQTCLCPFTADRPLVGGRFLSAILHKTPVKQLLKVYNQKLIIESEQSKNIVHYVTNVYYILSLMHIYIMSLMC